MGKASTKKRVQRASGAKKMAMRGKRRPYGFYALIAVLVVVGVGGIVLARGGSNAGADGARPGLQDHCDGKPGQLTIRQWTDATGTAFKDYTNARDVKITDGGAVTIAFLPAGTDIPKPATIANLNNPNAGEANGTTPTS